MVEHLYIKDPQKKKNQLWEQRDGPVIKSVNSVRTCVWFPAWLLCGSQPVTPAPELLSPPSGHDGHCTHVFSLPITLNIIKTKTLKMGGSFSLSRNCSVSESRDPCTLLVGARQPVGKVGWTSLQHLARTMCDPAAPLGVCASSTN